MASHSEMASNIVSANPTRPIPSPIYWILGFASLSVITVIASFETDGQFSLWQMVFRRFSVVALAFEIITIALAMSAGMSFGEMFRSLGKLSQALLSIWILAIAIGCFGAPDPDLAIISAVTWVLHILFAAALFFLVRLWSAGFAPMWQRRCINQLSIGIAICAFLVVGFVFIVGLDAKYDWIYRLPGLPHIRHGGYLVLPAITLSAAMIALHQGATRWLHCALLAANFAFGIWSGSRGPLVVFAVVMISAMLVFAAMRRKRALRDIGLALLVGTALSQLIPTPAHKSFNAIARLESEDKSSVGKLSSGRTDLWRDAAVLITAKPLFGHGGQQFRDIAPAAVKIYSQPHNSVLQFLFDWGLIGGGALLALLGLLALRVTKAVKSGGDDVIPFAMAAFALAAFSLIDGVFFYPLPIMFFLTFAFGAIYARGDRPA